MNQELIVMTEKWKSLERKTKTQREKADAFYENKLMQLIEQEFVESNHKKVYEQIEYLILSVGTSYEPLVLNIQLLQPRRILFLYTDKTEYILEKIVKYCQLDIMRFSKREVSGTDPLDIYREIKAAYLHWNRPEKIYIDFTGGTKAMSAAAAMAGAVINVQLVYVGTSEYLPDFRKPEPGSETLFYISNPMEIFGDLEIEKAFALFDKYNYPAAREKLGDLKEKVPTPDIRQQLTFTYHLAQAYEYWDALEFPKAYKAMSTLTKELERDSKLNQNFLLMDFFLALKRQEEILRHLNDLSEALCGKNNLQVLQNKEFMIPLMFTMYMNSEIRMKQEKYDTATLLLYRLLEMIEQRRLAMYNLYVSAVNYNNLAYNLERQPELKDLNAKERFEHLKESVSEIKQSLFKANTANYLPDKISLLDGFILLYALNDKISESKTAKPIDKLKRIRSMVYLRNNSIFAHGLGPVSVGDFQKFRQFVIEIFREFCELEQVDFDAYAKDMEWLNPLRSKNYAGMEGSELWQ